MHYCDAMTINLTRWLLHDEWAGSIYSLNITKKGWITWQVRCSGMVLDFILFVCITTHNLWILSWIFHFTFSGFNWPQMSSLAFCCCDKCHDQNQFGVERDYLSYTSHFQSKIKGSQGRNLGRTGVRSHKKLITDLISMAWTWFLIPPRTTCQWVALTTVGWALP